MNLPTSLEHLKKLLKEENRETGRLASLKPARDLTLQPSNSKQKRNYTPNVNVIRNKEKPKFSPPKAENKRKRYPDRSGGNQNKRPRFLQTESIFSHGISDARRDGPISNLLRAKQALTSIINSRATRLSKSPLTIPNVKFSDFVVENDDSDTDCEYDPVVIPLPRNKDKFINTCRIRADTKVAVKQELDSFPDADILSEYVCANEYDSLEFKPTPQCSFKSDNKFYDDDNPSISIIKMPSSMRGQPSCKQKENDEGSISMIEEGQIGTIRIRRSGKMEVVVRNTTYTLEHSSPSESVENVVLFPGKDSISLEPSVVTLSPVNESYVMGLDWENLFTEAKHSARKYYW